MFNILAAAIKTTCTTGFDGVQSCTQSNISSGGFFALMASLWLIFIAIYIFMVVVQWKIFVKAGKPGWASLIPIYNTVVLLQIVGKPDWWVILLMVPMVNAAVLIIIALELAKSFAKSSTFAIFGLILFPIVGYPMLALDKSTYVGPGGKTSAPQHPAPNLDTTANTPPTPTPTQ